MRNCKELSLLLVIALGLFIACPGGLPPEFPAPDFTLKSPLTGKDTACHLLFPRCSQCPLSGTFCP